MGAVPFQDAKRNLSGLGRGRPAVDEQPQGDGGVVRGGPAQTGGAQGRNGDDVGIDGVGLAALTGREHPGSRRELRGHVNDSLAVGDQALGHVPADAVAALDRPHAVSVTPAAGSEFGNSWRLIGMV
jgi:hypothetical protein